MKLLLNINTRHILNRDGDKIRCMIFKGRPYIGVGSLAVCDEGSKVGIYLVLNSECPSDPGDQHFFTAQKICDIPCNKINTNSTASMCQAFAEYNKELMEKHNSLPWYKRIFDWPNYIPKDFCSVANRQEYKGFI